MTPVLVVGRTGELVIGLRLAGSSYRFWMLRGGLGEARHWLEQARFSSTAGGRTRGMC